MGRLLTIARVAATYTWDGDWRRFRLRPGITAILRFLWPSGVLSMAQVSYSLS